MVDKRGGGHNCRDMCFDLYCLYSAHVTKKTRMSCTQFFCKSCKKEFFFSSKYERHLLSRNHLRRLKNVADFAAFQAATRTESDVATETGQCESSIVSTTEHESSIEVVPDVCAIEGRGSTSCSSASSANEDSVSNKVHVHEWSIS